MAAGVSVLSALFFRARTDEGTQRDAFEDFTTEALAGALRRDPAPFLRALRVAGAFDTAPMDAEPLVVITQRTYAIADGLGLSVDVVRPDLVLLWAAFKPPTELWIEVKTAALLSGQDQLRRYRRAQRYLESGDAVARPAVVLLSPSDVRHDRPDRSKRPVELGTRSDEPWMPWQAIADEVARRPSDTLWLELCLFLKENGMTKERSFPITAREATSLVDAYQLYEKTAVLLKEVNRRGQSEFPDVASGWYRAGDITPMMRREFRDNGRLTISLWGHSKIGVLFGVIPNDVGEATYTVRIEADPRIGEARARVHAVAQEGRLIDGAWRLEFDSWPLLTARGHTVNFESLDTAAEWFIDRFRDLQTAGVLRLQHELTREGTPPGEPAEVTTA